MHTRWVVSCLGLASNSLIAGSLVAGQATHVADAPTCPACRIAVDTVAILGRYEPWLREGPSSIGRDSRWRYFVTQPNRSEPPWVFDRDGKHLATLGRLGGGPGEYRGANRVLVTPGDSLVVFDQANGRMTVLSPDLQLIRGAPLTAFVFSAAWLPTSTIVVNAAVPTRERIGHPFHVFDRVGNVLRSFGDDGVANYAHDTPRLLRHLAPAGQDRFWSVTVQFRYVVEQWTSGGQLVQRFERQPSWFPRDVPISPITPTAPPTPFVGGVWLTGDGLVWVLIRIADPRWRSAIAPGPTREGRGTSTVTDRKLVYDTFIEVLDPVTGKLVASQRFDNAWHMVTQQGELIELHEDSEGKLLIYVARAELHR
jgi:hypothetical protein